MDLPTFVFPGKFAFAKDFQEKLYKELVSRIKETDQQPPYPHGPYVYLYARSPSLIGIA